MWSAHDVLARLIPTCRCGAAYDLRFCSPHILPCSHTFCFICLSKDKQRKKRRCPLCQKKYSSFILNAALAETVERMRMRREWLERKSGKCDECESRRPTTAMRRCLTCFRNINKLVSPGLTMDCVICLECCVVRHNGHNLVAVSSSSSFTSASQPTTFHARQDSKRYLPWKVMSNQMKLFKQGIIADYEHCTWQERRSKPSDSNGGISSHVVEEELVCETRSPLYYRVSSSISENVPHKSISTRLSELIKRVIGSRTSLAIKSESLHHSKSNDLEKTSASSSISNSGREDSSIYQKISPYRHNGKAASSSLSLNRTENLGCEPYYVNVYRRHSD